MLHWPVQEKDHRSWWRASTNGSSYQTCFDNIVGWGAKTVGPSDTIRYPTCLLTFSPMFFQQGSKPPSSRDSAEKLLTWCCTTCDCGWWRRGRSTIGLQMMRIMHQNIVVCGDPWPSFLMKYFTLFFKPWCFSFWGCTTLSQGILKKGNFYFYWFMSKEWWLAPAMWCQAIVVLLTITVLDKNWKTWLRLIWTYTGQNQPSRLDSKQSQTVVLSPRSPWIAKMKTMISEEPPLLPCQPSYPRFAEDLDEMRNDLETPHASAEQLHERCREGISDWTTTDVSWQIMWTPIYHCALDFPLVRLEVALSRWFHWDAGWRAFAPFWTFARKVYGFRKRLRTGIKEDEASTPYVLWGNGNCKTFSPDTRVSCVFPQG